MLENKALTVCPELMGGLELHAWWFTVRDSVIRQRYVSSPALHVSENRLNREFTASNPMKSG